MSALITEEELYNYIPENDSLIEQAKELQKNIIKEKVKQVIAELRGNPYSTVTIFEPDNETRNVIEKVFRNKGYAVDVVKDSVYKTVPKLLIVLKRTKNNEI